MVSKSLVNVEAPSVELSPIQPRWILILVVVVSAVAGVMRWADAQPLVGAWLALAVVTGSAALIGCPVLVWALDTGRTRVWQFAVLGGVAGAVPAFLFLVSGMIGHLVRGDAEVDHVRWVLSYGAPIPWYGQMPWPAFLVLETHAVVIGSASAAIYWLLLVDNRLAMGARWALAGATLVFAAGVEAVLGR